jgi:hypothetical protein
MFYVFELVPMLPAIAVFCFYHLAEYLPGVGAVRQRLMNTWHTVPIRVMAPTSTSCRSWTKGEKIGTAKGSTVKLF